MRTKLIVETAEGPSRHALTDPPPPPRGWKEGMRPWRRAGTDPAAREEEQTNLYRTVLRCRFKADSD